jgi:hypothetical protein
MRDYIPTAMASIACVIYVMVAGHFGYSREALLLLIIVGIPVALLLRYRRLGTLIRKDDKDH